MIFQRTFLRMGRVGFSIVLLLVPSRSQAVDPEFDKLVDDYFAARFDYRPSEGTAAVLHEYDQRLEDLSRERTARRIDELVHRPRDSHGEGLARLFRGTCRGMGSRGGRTG
jgi:hypothetical protein